MIITNPSRIRAALGRIGSSGDPQVAQISQAVAGTIGEFGALPLSDLSSAGLAPLRKGDDQEVFAGRVVDLLNQAATESGLAVRLRLSDGLGADDRWIWFESVPDGESAVLRSVIGTSGGVLFSWRGSPITACAISSKGDITALGDAAGRLMALSIPTGLYPRSELWDGSPMGSAVRDIQLSVEGGFVLGVAKDGRVQVEDTSTETMLWMDYGWQVAAMTQNCDSVVMATSNGQDGVARIVGGKTGCVRREIPLPGAERVDACAILNDHEIAIAAMFGGEGRIVRMSKTQPSGLRVARYKDAAHRLAFPCLGSSLVVISTAEAMVGDDSTTHQDLVRRRKISRALDDTVAYRALSREGAMLAIAKANGDFEVWDTEHEQRVWSHSHHVNASAPSITSCAVSGCGKRIAVNLGDVVRVYARFPTSL